MQAGRAQCPPPRRRRSCSTDPLRPGSGNQFSMPTEKQKMLAGELYLPSDQALAAERLRCQKLLREYNTADPADEETRQRIATALVGRIGPGSWIEPPFHCDYGTNISIGARFYANFDCVILD